MDGLKERLANNDVRETQNDNSNSQSSVSPRPDRRHPQWPRRSLSRSSLRAHPPLTLLQLEALIRTTGFFRNKAKSIQGAARKIVSDFNGQVPQTLAELITIPGAARKTANVVLGVAYGKAEGVVVDTHVFRIARRLGLAKSETPQTVEQELMRILPESRWIGFSHQVIHHGRAVCAARKPKCDRCNLEQLCNSKDKTWHS
jgi:endonuclease-3